MSKQPQRGRLVAPQKKNNLTSFYVLIGVLAIVGIAIVVTTATGTTSSLPAAITTPAPNTTATLPPVIPFTPGPPTIASNGDTTTTASGTTSEGFYYKGNPDAPITIVEYSDFQCPGCSYYAQNFVPEINQRYIETGKAWLIFHDFPLTFHQHSQKASEASRCAGEQGAFWEMHNMLFERQKMWDNEASPEKTQFPTYAEELGINKTMFTECLNSNKYSKQVADSYNTSVQAGINQTPTFVVNGQKVENIEQVFDVIDTAIAHTKE